MILTTKFAGPTDSRGSRVLVYVGARKAKAVPWDHALDSEANHERAARIVASLVYDVEVVAEGEWTVHINLALPDAANHSRVIVLDPPRRDLGLLPLRVEAGRTIVGRDGTVLASLAKEDGATPTMADRLVHDLVDALNARHAR